MPHIVRNARAPPATPEAYGCSKHTDAELRAGDRKGRKDAASKHRSGQEKYNQVKDPKQVERGGIRTRNCCINVHYV